MSPAQSIKVRGGLCSLSAIWADNAGTTMNGKAHGRLLHGTGTRIARHSHRMPKEVATLAAVVRTAS